MIDNGLNRLNNSKTKFGYHTNVDCSSLFCPGFILYGIWSQSPQVFLHFFRREMLWFWQNSCSQFGALSKHFPFNNFSKSTFLICSSTMALVCLVGASLLKLFLLFLQSSLCPCHMSQYSQSLCVIPCLQRPCHPASKLAGTIKYTKLKSKRAAAPAATVTPIAFKINCRVMWHQFKSSCHKYVETRLYDDVYFSWL